MQNCGALVSRFARPKVFDPSFCWTLSKSNQFLFGLRCLKLIFLVIGAFYLLEPWFFLPRRPKFVAIESAETKIICLKCTQSRVASKAVLWEKRNHLRWRQNDEAKLMFQNVYTGITLLIGEMN